MKGCCMGKHSDDAVPVTTGTDGFWRSQTVANASNANEKERIAQLKTAADFNKEQEEKKAVKIQAEAANIANKKPVMTKDGTKFMCANKGCTAKSFIEGDNNDAACQHHVGEPVFHDLKKYWSCCTAKPAYDWDEFMKLPTCTVGAHVIKYK